MASEYSSEDEFETLQGPVRPYLFEPTAKPGTVRQEQPTNEANCSTRLQDMAWCKCGHCARMSTDEECKCCSEIMEVMEKCQECDTEQNLMCITQHPGFQSVVLCQWNLQAVYYEYRQKYGDLDEPTLHKRYRYTAYRHFVRWCWGYVGKHVRIILPACVVSAIRARFPSDSYEGFKLPSLD